MSITAIPPARAEAGSRGKLVIAEKVIEKVASQAAADLADVGSPGRGFLGMGPRQDFDARPKVDVELSGNIATIALDIGVRYPVPLRSATERVREQVRERVHALTGVEVRQVDIVVSWLRPQGSGAGTRVLL
ncbi:Asp23/Gls24 family envelope stress response protein [Saxibacter everestensis]|uniref:Asp23/Gls24 family envelope stress response protein n=1 Tax=Saxibacter everestensis TaxID=2909229 RepID=A0ABY8QS08_9MICO|nr:Asp23/Gls24 family envelope stress response protein [Brevibacteriaceae bacterium ZFBP1038]